MTRRRLAVIQWTPRSSLLSRWEVVCATPTCARAARSEVSNRKNAPSSAQKTALPRGSKERHRANAAATVSAIWDFDVAVSIHFALVALDDRLAQT
jgi:hypothetical protein